MLSSLIKLPLAEAIEWLAKRAVDRRANPPSWFEKIALQRSDVLNSVGQVMNDPIAGKAAIGAGIGAGVGGISGALSGGSFHDRRKRAVRSLLTGGLAGGVVGGGVGAVQKGTGFKFPGAGGTGGGPAAAPPVNKYPDLQKSLKAHPELGAKIKELSSPSIETQIGDTAAGGIGAAGYYAPFTTGIGATILGRKALTNVSPGFRRWRGMEGNPLANLQAGLGATAKSKEHPQGEAIKKLMGLPESEQSGILQQSQVPSLRARLQSPITTGGSFNPLRWKTRTPLRSHAESDLDATRVTPTAPTKAIEDAEKLVRQGGRGQGGGGHGRGGTPPVPPTPNPAQAKLIADLEKAKLNSATQQVGSLLNPKSQVLRTSDVREMAGSGRDLLSAEHAKLAPRFSAHGPAMVGGIGADLLLNYQRGAQKDRASHEELNRILAQVAHEGKEGRRS